MERVRIAAVAVATGALLAAGGCADPTAPVADQRPAPLAHPHDPRQWATGMLKIHDASQRVTVERCAGGDAQYNGGFVVHGARCVHLQVQDRGDSDARRLSLPFGTTDCA